MSQYWLLVADAAMAVMAIILILVVIIMKWRINRALIAAINEARAEGQQRYDEIRELLQINKDLATSARDNRVSTIHAVESVKQQLEQVPAKTAEKVAEKIPSSKDDWRAHDNPPAGG